jgi:hypothetical protein
MKALLLLWFSAWFSNVTVTQYVDDIEARLRANRDTYLSGAHTIGRRDEAVQYFDQQWTRLKTSEGCGSRLLGSAGKRCLDERSRNGSWPWETYYRDPITETPAK